MNRFTFVLAFAAFSSFSSVSVAQHPEQARPEVTYEIFVQSFADSDGDGIGDFAGMTEKLGYLERLGVDRVWLMPIQPSPSYHKYDVTDYRAVHPDYGTMKEFKSFVAEAHERGIDVIIDLVLNHTAKAHPWFQSAMKNQDSPYRNFYVWATDDEVEEGAPAAARGGELRPHEWHDAPGPEDYYGLFWQGMPDLNFDNPAVRDTLIDIGQFWLRDVGVDGFRLDAARHIYPDDRTADSYAWWAQFRKAMQEVDEDVYLVGEVWGTTEEVAPYFQGLDALFNFDLSFAIQEALKTGEADSLAVLDERIRDVYRRENEHFSDATFLKNHDQNRLRSMLGGSLKKAEMGASLLFTLPGDPYIYYGEEIGMLGMKPDPHIREPILWETGGSAERAEWIDPVYSTEATVAPVSRRSAILTHYRDLIRLRSAHPALAEGKIEAVPTEQRSVAAFRRTIEDETLLVLHNVASRSVEVQLPKRLAAFRETVWAKSGLMNADQGNRALEHSGSISPKPAVLGEGRLRLPGLSTLILRRR